MTFVHPAFLWALLLGGVPVAIYYLIRFRSLQVEWGASYVLQRALDRLRKKKNREQWILMALRILAVMALVAAFARPMSRRKDQAAAGEGVFRVIVLDASGSMRAGPAGRTGWDRAVALGRQLAGSWSRGERWSLRILGREPFWAVDDQPAVSPEANAAFFDGLEPAESPSPLAAGLEAVFRKTAGRPSEIYILSDDQASAWKGVEELALPEPRPRLFWINAAAADRENLTVTRLVLDRDRVLAGHPVRAVVFVRHFGSRPVENAELDILVDGAFHAREAVSVLPGQEVQVAADLLLAEPGSHAVTARLRADALIDDNTASAGIEVAESLRVVVLRDADRTDKFASAWGFLELASRILGGSSGEGAPFFAGAPVQAVLAADAAAVTASGRVDAVVADGGFTPSAEAVAALREYVRKGGGLVLAADEGADPGAWNAAWGGAGLLPARLRSVRREALGGERFRTLKPEGFEAPGLRALASREDGDIAESRLYAWMELEEPEEGAVVMARFDDGSPFAVGRRFGEGGVILLAAGLNSRNNNLVVREFTYPLLVNLLSTAAAAGVEPRTVAPGAPIRLQIDSDEPPSAVQFALQERPPVPLGAPDAAGFVSLPAGAERSGLGSILATWKDRFRRTWIGVQGRREDSDLAPVEAEGKARLRERLGLEECAGWEALQAALEAGRRGREWHHWAMLAVLALLLGEMAFQRRFV